MAKQTINVGTGELAGDGESLRSAFQKINANFDELYVSPGITGPQGPVGPTGPQGDLGPTGPTGPSDFTNISSHVLPSSDLTYDLGSTSSQWRSLYVGTSTIYIGGKALSVTPAGDITVDGSPIGGGGGGGGAANTGDIIFTATTITAPADSSIRIVATDTIYNRALVDLDTSVGNVALRAWSGENTRSDTNAWNTGTWTINPYGNPYMRFEGASDLVYWFTNTLQNSDPDTVSYSINGGEYIAWDGGSSSDPTTGFLEIYTSGVNPPGNTTTNITSLDWKYRFTSGIQVGFNNGLSLDSGDQYIGINAGSYIQMFAKGSIDISNSDASGSDIEINSGDDIWIRGKDKTSSDSEGGDINIEAGDGGNADLGDGGGTGGDVRIIAGRGGNAGSAYMGGVGGFIQVYSGDGGSANAANGQTSNNGGDLELQAGSAGFNDGNPAFGNAGGNLEIRAGNSNNYIDNGGNVIIQPGTNTAGTSTVAGYVRIQVPSSSGAAGGSWYFEGDGQTLRFPDGTTQTTAYTGGGGGGGTTSTLTAGTATLSINTLSETVLPSGLKFEPIENYGFGFGGTIAMQTYGEQLQMLATGTGAFGLFGYGEVIGGPGGVAYLVGNQDGTNEVKIVAGSYTATVNTWEFKNNGDLIIPNAILGSGDQALVIQNTASGVAYLELPVDPSADSVILANQAANSATVTIRVGDFGSEKNWTFNEFGALATPGIIYNTDTSNVGQLLLQGDIGESATYLALPSDVGSASMNVRLANQNGNIQLYAGNNSWLFNNTGDLELPGGSVLATSGYDVALLAGNDGNSTFGSVTINTQGPPEVFTVTQEGGIPAGAGTAYISGSPSNSPAFASITVGMLVTGPNLVGVTTVTNVTIDGFGSYTITTDADEIDPFTYGSVYTFTPASGVTDRNWEFNSLGELNLPQGGAIQETQVTNELWGTTTTSLTLVPGGAGNGTQRLEIYATGGGEGDHIHITSGDQNQTDLFLGNDTQYYAVAASGANYIQARNGAASTGPGVSAGPGANVNIYAGNAGDNGGNVADGNSGGDVFISSGISSSGLGGDILINTSSGPDGFGSIELSTDGGSSYWTFNKDNELVFPDNTVQTTAFTGTSALLDITNTNGIDTTYYLTFVENRTANQEVRADVDLTWNSWSNTLGVGKISVNSTASSTSTTTGALTVAGGVGIQGDLWAGNIYSNGVQLTAGGGGGGSGVTSLTAGTGTFVSSTSGAVTIWVGNTSNLEETFESKTTATGVVVHDCTTNRLFYHTGATGNITPNFTNLGLAAGEATSISLVVVQGGTARNVSGVQIAGTTTGVTLVWQGSASAPSGNANRTDVFSFSILCTATNAYTVLGMLTSFGGI